MPAGDPVDTKARKVQVSIMGRWNSPKEGGHRAYGAHSGATWRHSRPPHSSNSDNLSLCCYVVIIGPRFIDGLFYYRFIILRVVPSK